MIMSDATQIALFIFVGIFAVTTVVLMGAMAFALSKLVKLLDTLADKLDPVVAKATDTIETVQRITANVGEKADTILSKGEMLTDKVTVKVEETSEIVQKAVTGPLITVSSVIAGISKGFSVYTHPSNGGAKAYRGNGTKKQ